MKRTTSRQRQRLVDRIMVQTAEKAVPLLERLGFSDPQGAVQCLDRLAGSAPVPQPLPPKTLLAFVETGRPDRGLRHLERLIDSSGGRSALFGRFVQAPILGRNVAEVLCASDFLADILVRNPEYLYWLFEETPFLTQPLPKAELRRIMRREIEYASRGHRRLEALRRVQRRELLRLGTAEILGVKPVERIGRELADLADVVVEIALSEARTEIVHRYGQPRTLRGQPAQFCVICLGKHGGRELNYSSDIDLLFVYDDEGQAKGANGELANHEFFNRLGERLIQMLTEVTPQGFLYRVDMRLRPEGEAGSLARSLRSYWIYYESRGQLWERQMLIKARRAGGSAQLWRQFCQMVTPFVYPAHFSASPHEEIRRIKERIEAQILSQPAKGNNIKLRPGGIRDIEFIVQCLQLLQGRIKTGVRTENTLEALGRLERAKALSGVEAKRLRQAYCFYRRLENLLQIEAARPIYAVPISQRERAALARLLDKKLGVFERELESHLNRVRAIFDQLFQDSIEPPDQMIWLLEVKAAHPQAVEYLNQQGFSQAEAAHRHLLELAHSEMGSLAGQGHFRELLAELVGNLIASPDPDQGLLNFVQIIQAYGAPRTFFQLLHTHPNFRKLLISLCSTSCYLAMLIQRDPGLLDSLVDPSEIDYSLVLGEGHGAAIGRYRNQKVLRIGTDDLLGLSSSGETFLRLSELAEEVLGAVYAQAWRNIAQRRGRPQRGGHPARFTCFAGGKLGGRELNFGSDMDLFFVYSGEGKTGRGCDNRTFFIELAREIIHLLGLWQLYEVDARLRPEGRNAPVVIALPTYRRYLQSRGATWERLALSRARPVAGDASLGRQVQNAIGQFVYAKPLKRDTIAEIRAMRQRMEPRLKRAELDIKRGPGGIVDIEFIAQIWVLKLGGANRRMRLGNTGQILAHLAEGGYLRPEQSRLLVRAYEDLRRLEKSMRFAHNLGASTLPQGRPLSALARLSGFEQPEQLTEATGQLMLQVRRCFSEIFEQLSAESGE